MAILNDNQATASYNVIVGLGQTGLSCARYLHQLGEPFVVFDSRENPPGVAEIRALDETIEIFCGAAPESLFAQASMVICSPGVAKSSRFLDAARDRNLPIIGDIELFARAVTKPVLAITGSNGKTTVTTLVGELLKTAGVNVKVGGNIGVPALELLSGDEPDCYLLELSSFQLETTLTLKPKVATVLNISDDHMDRYDDLGQYIDAKQSIYRRAEHVVINLDDEQTWVQVPGVYALHGFSTKLSTNQLGDGHWGLRADQHKPGHYSICRGEQKILESAQLKLVGLHNYANVMAALAMLDGMNIDIDDAVITKLESFTGLPHRCEWVTQSEGVTWINDSKATNPGATAAALDSFTDIYASNVILIAGGDAKGADLSVLAEVFANQTKTVICFGQDGGLVAQQAGRKGVLVKDLAEAVAMANELAQSGDLVLLSPACASLDMFTNYEARGAAFIELVNTQVSGGAQ